LKFNLFLGDPGYKGSLTWSPSVTVSSVTKAFKDLKIQSFVSALHHKTKDRKFFITSRGYIGLSSPRVKVGDVVCVFPRLSVPVIMCKTDSHYTYQGECFVLRVMDREVIDNLEKGIVSLEGIEIY